MMKGHLGQLKTGSSVLSTPKIKGSRQHNKTVGEVSPALHKSCTGRVAQVEDQMECLHGPSQGWLILEVNCVKRLDVVIVNWTTDTFQKCPSGAKMQVTE